MDFRDRLMEALRIAGKTRAQLADEIGVSPAAISHWTLGKVSTLRGQTAAKLEAATGVRSTWLLTGEGPKLTREAVNVAPAPGSLPIPCIDLDVAQTWPESPNPYEMGRQPKWLVTDQSVSKSSFALKVYDTSMSPDLERDDLVVADPATPPSPGSLVVADVEGQGVVIRKYRLRRVKADGESFDLIPSNNNHPIISSDDVSVKIIATVLEYRRYFNQAH